jgi:PII-like signaling protein
MTAKWHADVEMLDAIGFKTQPWKASADSQSLELPTLDVNWLMAQPALPYIVQLVPTQLLYRSLQAQGFEDSLEVLEHIRGETLVRLLDYELWTVPEGQNNFLTPDEDVSADRFLQWVKLWNEISPEFAAERFVELEESVIVGCLTALCEIVPVGLNRQQEELSDDYWMTPDNKFGLKIKTNGESDFEILHGFIHALYSKDVRIAQQILSYSAMMIREEALEDARRWRQGRLEDQGFLSSDEARSLLAPRGKKQILEMIKNAVENIDNIETSDALNQKEKDELVIAHPRDREESLNRIRDFVSSLQEDELRQEMESILGPEEILRLVGNSQPPTEILVNDEEAVETFVEKIVNDTHTLLVQLEAHSAKLLNQRQGDSTQLLFDRVMNKVSEFEPALALSWKSRLARTTNVLAVAMGVAKETAELGRVLMAVRGCLNIGLQKISREPAAFGVQIAARKGASAQFSPDDEHAAFLVLKAVGPEVLFQVGWQSLQELAQDALRSILGVLEAEETRANVAAHYDVRLSDGQLIKIPVMKLLEQGRYLEVRKWLTGLGDVFVESIAHILLSTVNRLPVFPIILDEEGKVTRGTTDIRPYETIEDTEKTRGFLAGLSSVRSAMALEE